MRRPRPRLRALLVAVLVASCANLEVRERCRFVTEHTRRPPMPAELVPVDSLLLNRTIQAAAEVRQMNRSFSAVFKQDFAERYLPVFCGRYERARLLAAGGDRRSAAVAYEGLLLASQVTQLMVAVMLIANHADAAGQPSGEISQILNVFAEQMQPLLDASLSDDPKVIERAIKKHGVVYAAWIRYIEGWSGLLKVGAERVKVAKYVWDAAMLSVAAWEAAAGLASIAAAGRPPPGSLPFGASGGAAVVLDRAAAAQIAEALRKLIAQGAIDADLIVGLSTLGAPTGAVPALPDSRLPTLQQMGSGDVPPNMAKVKKINGRYPINAEYAGRTYPAEELPQALQAKYPNGVRFDEEGFPDFSPYSVRQVDIKMTGFRQTDIKQANQAAGIEKLPKGMTWHHHQNCRTMQMVPKDLHDAVRHTGGVSILRGGVAE